MKRLHKKIDWKSPLLFCVIMGLALGISSLLSRAAGNDNPFAGPIFILAVALISRVTSGYVYGILASFLSVAFVNIIFTYPYWEFNLSITGYTLTFAVMLFVSITISTLTTRLMQQEKLRFEAEKEKMRANLLRSISHDIRTPLASIMGASSTLLENRALPERDRDELLGEINKDARWLVRVTENILSVTKFSGEDVVLKKSDEVVEEIVGSAIVKFRRMQPSLPITVKKPQEIVLAPMDAMLIEQVLMNLFENVVAHGEKATRIRTTVECRKKRVVISVADDGVGIPPDKLPHIFDGMNTSDQSETPDGKRNMGIGLSVCNAIICAHGGGMAAENNEFGGATVRFWLPCEENHNEQYDS